MSFSLRQRLGGGEHSDWSGRRVRWGLGGDVLWEQELREVDRESELKRKASFNGDGLIEQINKFN